MILFVVKLETSTHFGSVSIHGEKKSPTECFCYLLQSNEVHFWNQFPSFSLIKQSQKKKKVNQLPEFWSGLICVWLSASSDDMTSM